MSNSNQAGHSGAQDSCIALVRPGRRPAEVVAVYRGQEFQIPLVPAATPEDATSPAEREVRRRILAQRESLLSIWATGFERELGFPRASAHAVTPEAGKTWRFALDNGAAVSVPFDWIGRELKNNQSHPFPVQNGRWWVWPDVPLAAEVGDLLAALSTGATEGPGLYCTLLAPTGADGEREFTGTAPMLGLILVRQEVLGRTQLELALRYQADQQAIGNPVLLGQAAVKLGFITHDQLSFALDFQSRLRGLGEWDQRFAAFVLELGAVSPATLMYAVDRQESGGKGLADILVEEGWVLSLVVQEFEALHSPPGEQPAPLQEPAPEPVPEYLRYTLSGAGIKSLIGVILQREDFMTPEQVALVLNEQLRLRRAGSPVAFGQIALELGFINTAQLQFALTLQSHLDYPPGTPKPLGVFLLEHGVARPSQLLNAIEQAERTGSPLDHLLIERGVITSNLLNVFLAMQKRDSEVQSA